MLRANTCCMLTGDRRLAQQQARCASLSCRSRARCVYYDRSPSAQVATFAGVFHATPVPSTLRSVDTRSVDMLVHIALTLCVSDKANIFNFI